MNKKLAMLLAVGALFSGAIEAQAVAITGDISFTSTAGGAAWEGDGGNVNTIETIVSFGDSQVDGGSGSFTGLVGTAVVWGQPLDFVTPVSIVNPLWTVANFEFNMTSIIGIQRTDTIGIDTLTIDGAGSIENTLTGDTVVGFWSWSGKLDGTQEFRFTSSTIAAVPDGGATAMLLGVGVLGLAGLRRKLS